MNHQKGQIYEETIMKLTAERVPYREIAIMLGISKSSVAYYVKKNHKNQRQLMETCSKIKKSRLFHGTVTDFDEGVISVLNKSSLFHDGQGKLLPISRKAAKLAAIPFAENNNGRANFKASDGWAGKFIQRLAKAKQTNYIPQNNAGSFDDAVLNMVVNCQYSFFLGFFTTILSIILSLI
jgi:hypothetical protein